MFPISNWTEMDVWQYIEREGLELPSIYFAHSRKVVMRQGAIVPVTHDEGAGEALNPERVLLMPDGDEDLWNDSYLELVAEE